MRYIGAISDTDILINFAKVNRLDVLEYLFEEIIIPQYIYDFEIKIKAIIISDNYTEFKWLDEFITLTHRNILALCVYFGDIEQSEAEYIFNRINSELSYPTQDTFEEQYRKAMRRFRRKSLYIGNGYISKVPSIGCGKEVGS